MSDTQLPGDLDEVWRAVEEALATRPYPGTDEIGFWGVQLYSYPASDTPYASGDRYHATAAPAIDSHHRNAVRATGMTPAEALQRLLDALEASDDGSMRHAADAEPQPTD